MIIFCIFFLFFCPRNFYDVIDVAAVIENELFKLLLSDVFDALLVGLLPIRFELSRSELDVERCRVVDWQFEVWLEGRGSISWAKLLSSVSCLVRRLSSSSTLIVLFIVFKGIVFEGGDELRVVVIGTLEVNDEFELIVSRNR